MRLRLINSAIAFALACLVMITVHETAHAVAGLLQGNSPVMHGFSVDDRSATDHQHLITALAGPAFSFVSGLVVLAIPLGSLNPFARLVVLWFGLLSVQEFSGYLITGPFASIGDIGIALSLAGAPAVVGWIGFVIGWALTYLLARVAVRRIAEFASDSENLAPQMRALGLFAWLTGVVMVLILSAGLLGAGDDSVGDVVFEALGLIAAGIFLVFVRPFMPIAEKARHGGAEFGLPILGLVLLVVVAVVRQIVFA